MNNDKLKCRGNNKGQWMMINVRTDVTCKHEIACD